MGAWMIDRLSDARQTAGMATATSSQRGRTLCLDVAGVAFDLRPACTAYLPEHELLLVADLHLEKGSGYASRGQMLPPYDSAETLNRLVAEMEELQPRRVIALGDSFHDRGARARMDGAVVAALREMTAVVDWVWICGNHDVSPPEDLGGRIAQEVSIGPLVFRHEPVGGPVMGEIAGHLHPCARVSGRVRSVRAKCFAANEGRLVMPSFGALTGGLNVCDEAFAPLFPNGVGAYVVGRDGVYAVSPDRLAPDRQRASRLAG